mgnify:CR=1 FL=1
MDLQTIRKQYPQYDDLSDQQLADALHRKHYSDIPKAEFYSRIGLGDSSPVSSGPAPTRPRMQHPAEQAGEPVPEAHFSDGVKRGLATGLYRNVLNTPEVIAQAALMPYQERPKELYGPDLDPFRLLFRGIESLTGYDVMEAGKELRSRPRVLPKVTPEDVMGASRAVADAPGLLLSGQGIDGLLSRSIATEEAMTERIRQQAPVGMAVGNLTADAATLAAGRVPLALARARSPKAVETVAKTLEHARLTVPELGRKIAQSGAMKRLARGAGRAAETSIEGAALSVLNDPEASREEVAAVMAGAGAGQAAGSVGLTTLKTAWRNPVKFGMATIGLIAMGRQLQEFAPGANNLFDASDDVFNNTSYLLTAGFAGVLMGAGRMKPENASAAVNLMADGLTSMQRGAAISVINDAVKAHSAGDDSLQRVAAAMVQNPSAFTEEQRTRFEKAVTSEDRSALAEAQNLLTEDDFRQRLRGVETGINAEIRRMVRADTKEAPAFRPSQTAQAVQRVLGMNRSKELGFENGSLPREFIRKAFEGGYADQLKRLGKAQFEEAGGILLERMIRQNSTDLRLDGEKFRAAWDALPEKSKRLFSKKVRTAIKAFSEQPGVTGVPDHMARALINPDSQLVALLNRNPTER